MALWKLLQLGQTLPSLFDGIQSMRRENTASRVQLWHRWFDRCEGGERDPWGKPCWGPHYSQLVTTTIGHWKVIAFHLRPFFDQKQKVKSWGSLTDYSDLLCEKVVDVYDQNTSIVSFWSLATSLGHVGIQHGKLMWHKIQPGPIRCFTWAEPINSAFYICFFLSIYASYMGLAH